MFKAVLEVLMAETAGITEFRDVTPSRLLDGYERFVGKSCLLLQVPQDEGEFRLTLRVLMSYIYIYIYMEHLFLMFLDHTQGRSTVGRTPLDE